MFRILVINPGSTSTKLALFEQNKCVWQTKIQYTAESLQFFKSSLEQKTKRLKDVLDALDDTKTDLKGVHAIAARGGPYKPLSGGTYRIQEKLIADIENGRVQADHISNVAALIAWEIRKLFKIPAYFVDPVSVDEMDPLARYSGTPVLARRSLVHALNVKEAGRRYAQVAGKPFESLNLIVAHLGGGISIVPLKQGRIVDVNNANEEGPFSPERAGTLPAYSLMRLCFTGQYSEQELKKMIVGEGGLTGYLGCNDLAEIEKRIDAGDTSAQEVLSAMAYQIAKEIGAMCTVLKGRVDQIVLTGGAAHSRKLLHQIKERTSFLAGITVFAGEFEMEALASGVLRVLMDEEPVREYS